MSNQAIATPNNNNNKVLEAVTARVRTFQNNGEIHFPPNYSPENALKSAWLIIQETLDKDKRPVLQSCSQASVANAMLKMVTEGLNPTKKQCYFIAKAGKLYCDTSYLGEKAKAKSIPTVKDIYEGVVYAKDEFEYEIRKNKKVVTKHTQKLGNINVNEIIAVYCVIEKTDGEEITEIMTWAQVQESWKKSQGWDKDKNKWKYSTPHQDQPDQMALRTVIKRACKHFVGTSDDSNLLLEQYRRAETEYIDAEIDAEISENANTTPLFVDDAPTVDYDTGEIIEDTDEPDAPKVEETKDNTTPTTATSSAVVMGF